MVLGIAGGNGLEHVSKDKFEAVYGVDINEDYLRVVSERYKDLSGVLKCLCIDLTKDADKLPVVGDYVTFRYNRQGDSMILSVCERTSFLQRPDQAKTGVI